MEELNKYTKYKKYKSPFVKDGNYKNTKELSQLLPRGTWIVTEKIDGTNIRIILDQQKEDGSRDYYIGSRKLILNNEDKNSKQFLDCIKDVNINKLIDYFKDIKHTITIYGEGYGAGVQTGHIYSQDKNYRVFDIKIGDVYQDWTYVCKVCVDNQLNIVPLLGNSKELSYDKCVGLLNTFHNTLIQEGIGGTPEGVVYKFEPVLLDKYGERLIFKVKFKDFYDFQKIKK